MSHHTPLTPDVADHTSDWFSFFHVATSHDAYLAVRCRDGLLCNARDPHETGYIPLVAIRLSSRPDFLFLTTDTPSQPQLWVEHFTARGCVLTVQMNVSGPQSQLFSFEDPSRPKNYFTTRPFSDGQTANPVVGDCNHVMGWEEFRLVPVSSTDRLNGIANDIAHLARRDVTANDLVHYIQNYNGDNLLPALDSLIPLIRWEEIEKLGERLLHDALLRQELQDIVPNNIWLDKALPELAHWELRRLTHANKTISPFPVARELHSPEEDSLLAWSGADSSFAGFLHALTHAARRTIEPRRTVCMVTTVRNEGIYLLEWIAYHRSIGVEHFFIYSNDNADGSEKLLEELAHQGIITWIDNPTSSDQSPQFKAYGHALNALPDILNFKWCFIVDGDEFITLNPQPYPLLTDYLNWIDHWQTDAIAVNWRFIASSMNANGLSDLAVPLTQRNERIVGNGAIGDGWRLVKSACRPNRTLHSRPHHPLWNPVTSYTFRLTNGDTHNYLNPPPPFPRDPAFADYGTYDRICISHYYFKSMAEWTWKHARNSGADAYKELDTSRYTTQWANTFGMQLQDPQHELNYWMVERRDATLRELAALRAHPAIRKAENFIRSTLNEQLLDLWQRIQSQKTLDGIAEEWRFIVQDLELELRNTIPLHSDDV
ncbi:glycosyltransferase family 92 protein [Saccharibacter sp. 17.LH.SD]|uniref:glycosyltransferase family 2 protein n=1 Tax=Saccharibacter sp. 17.LH.SD TaxID=2689393 RepID=UPI00136BD1E8|nr:glycosyltransferase family 2 protein [Saccharibacter sp. 17.LH.SD]MXV43827.1 glycosyltransferase family 92 protein [Saccharibacter sp. 17.LH.SD]